MKKWGIIFLALTVLFALSLGCTSSGKEKYIKCPKCGMYFNTKEGADWFQNMGRK